LWFVDCLFVCLFVCVCVCVSLSVSVCVFGGGVCGLGGTNLRPEVAPPALLELADDVDACDDTHNTHTHTHTHTHTPKPRALPRLHLHMSVCMRVTRRTGRQPKRPTAELGGPRLFRNSLRLGLGLGLLLRIRHHGWVRLGHCVCVSGGGVLKHREGPQSSSVAGYNHIAVTGGANAVFSR
jgi:hypothetical protein